MAVKHCAVCNVRMSKGHKKGPKPVTCSRSACKKKWAKSHMTFDMSHSHWTTASWINKLLRENPDAFDDDYYNV